MNNVQYRYIPHLKDRPSIYRNDEAIGGIDDHCFNTFYERIAMPPVVVRKKKDLELWTPASLKSTRKKKDVINVHMMVYDIDCGFEFENHKIFKNYDYVAHTSYSHKNDYHKWRLILPLKVAIPSNEWKYAWQVGIDFFEKMTGQKADLACKDQSRAYLRGGTTQENINNYRAIINETGQRLELSYIVPPPKKKRHYGQIKTFNVEEFRKFESAQPDSKKRHEIAIRKNAEIHVLPCDCNEETENHDIRIARKIICPKCERKSVWFFIDVHGRMYAARCNHVGKNNCGWTGSINLL